MKMQPKIGDFDKYILVLIEMIKSNGDTDRVNCRN